MACHSVLRSYYTLYVGYTVLPSSSNKQAGRQAGSGKSSSSNMKKRSKTLLCHGMKFIRTTSGSGFGWVRERKWNENGQTRDKFCVGWNEMSKLWLLLPSSSSSSTFVRCCESTHKIEIMVWGFSPVRQKRFASFIHLGCYCESSQNLKCELSFFPLPDNNFRYKIFYMKLQYIHLAVGLQYICSCIFFYQCRV